MSTDLIVDKQGRLGRIRLNRPKAIHALTTDMCLGIIGALAEFERDDDIAAVVFDHADGRGFCAGGDIRMLAESGQGDGSEARAFFHAEYRMNHRLFTYTKPTVAFMDGIVMGGGVGIALPCTWRVATENTRFAMPETGIGLFPDVGGGWYLSRLPGQVGKFIALTGARLDGAECLALGLATHFFDVAQLPNGIADILAEIEAELDTVSALYAAAFGQTGEPTNHGRVGKWITEAWKWSRSDALAIGLTGEATTPSRPGKWIVDASSSARSGAVEIGARDDLSVTRIGRSMANIDRMFAGETVEAIMAALDADGGEWAQKELATLRTKSPLSMAVSLRLLREGAAMPDFAAEMRQEYAIGARVVHTRDFIEGVRALIVDKDNTPQWVPDVADAEVDAIFAPMPPGQEWTPL